MGRASASRRIATFPMSDSVLRPVLTVYRRDGCHLCDDARQMLQDQLEARAFRGEPTPHVREVDIDADPATHDRYFTRIPVFAIGDDEIELVISGQQIRRFLERTLPQLA
jgi:glutaredoxin